MNLHRLACRFRQHVWTMYDDDAGDTSRATCEVCDKPHPDNVYLICERQGHRWGKWFTPDPRIVPITSEHADDISDYFLAEMLHRNETMFGKCIVDKPATKKRVCSCCKTHEDDAEVHFEGGALNTLYTYPQLGKLTTQWTEDRLQPEGNSQG